MLFEDKHFFIFDKPSSVVVDEEMFIKYLKKYGKDLHLVHRLDKDTTGILIIAKGVESREKFKNLFYKRKIIKNYLVAVEGRVKNNFGKISSCIEKIKYKNKTLSKVCIDGEKSLTVWKCLNKKNKFSLLKCITKTGRTHQLRVHFKSIGHPIVGDHIYGIKRKSVGRQLIHASCIEFLHPYTNENMKIRSQLPNDFKNVIANKEFNKL